MSLPEFDIGPGRWFGAQGVATPASQTNPVQSQVQQGSNGGGGLARLFQMWSHLQQGGGQHGPAPQAYQNANPNAAFLSHHPQFGQQVQQAQDAQAPVNSGYGGGMSFGDRYGMIRSY